MPFPWMAHDSDRGVDIPLPDTFPRMALVSRNLPAPRVDDPENAVRTALAELALADTIRPGQSVAVTAGSRGIASLPRILAVCCEVLKEHGASPFLVPSMGSHGGATDQGQVQTLHSLGITEEVVGAPIRSSMNTIRLSDAPCGARVHVDRLAAGADHILVVNRVKPHTKFKGPLESGLFKMLAVGLGKADGARHLHRMALSVPFPDLLASVGHVMLSELPILGGLGIVENHLGQAAHIRAFGPQDMERGEQGLLSMAKELHPRLPADDLDLLIVDRIGKNISGTGMDTNVTGRNRDILGPFADTPRISRILVLGLTPETKGNGLGLGFADFTTLRAVLDLDYRATVLNAMSGVSPEKAAIPIHLPTEREALAASLASLGDPDPSRVRIMRIRNTLRLEHLFVSEGLLPLLEDRVEVLMAPKAPIFDAEGRFADLFPGDA